MSTLYKNMVKLINKILFILIDCWYGHLKYVLIENIYIKKSGFD